MSEKQNNSPLIEVKDLKKYFDINTGMFTSRPLKAVDGVSFTINRGETLGLVGESGCGKTTVGRTLLHLYTPTSGKIIYDGKEIKTKADIHEFRKKATMVFQDPYSSLNPRMTVSDIIAEPLDIHKLYKSEEERREKVLELMEHVGLAGQMKKKTGKYSRGMRQRLGLADVLIKNPEIIILDEPTSGIDPAGVQEFIELIRQLSRKEGLTVLFSSHHLDQVQKVCDRVGLFNSGKLVTLIDMSDLKDKHQELSDIYNHYMEEGGERHE